MGSAGSMNGDPAQPAGRTVISKPLRGLQEFRMYMYISILTKIRHVQFTRMTASFDAKMLQ